MTESNQPVRNTEVRNLMAELTYNPPVIQQEPEVRYFNSLDLMSFLSGHTRCHRNVFIPGILGIKLLQRLFEEKYTRVHSMRVQYMTK